MGCKGILGLCNFCYYLINQEGRNKLRDGERIVVELFLRF